MQRVAGGCGTTQQKWVPWKALVAIAVILLFFFSALTAVLVRNGKWVFQAPPVSSTQPTQIGGVSLAARKSVWKSEYGEIVLTELDDGFVTGNYAFESGVITGYLIDRKLHGYWREDSEPDVACEKPGEDTKRWGRLIFRFASDLSSFEGK